MPFLLTFIAGCSTLLGYFFIYFNNRNNRVLIASLGFASGVMFFISLYDLIPEGIKLINKNYYIMFAVLLCLLFIVLGIIIAGFIDKYVSSGSNSDLYRVGIISMLAIIIHNVPEGVITYLTSTFNVRLGITLAISLALHNISYYTYIHV